MGEQLGLLAEFNALYTGRREFAAVEVTVESEHRPTHVDDDPLIPRLRRVDLANQTAVLAVTAPPPEGVAEPLGSAPAAAARVPRRNPTATLPSEVSSTAV